MVNYERKSWYSGYSIIKHLVYNTARFFGRPLNVLLITGDANFVELVEALRVIDIKVYLVGLAIALKSPRGGETISAVRVMEC